jgi:hypothetical protein
MAAAEHFGGRSFHQIFEGRGYTEGTGKRQKVQKSRLHKGYRQKEISAMQAAVNDAPLRRRTKDCSRFNALAATILSHDDHSAAARATVPRPASSVCLRPPKCSPDRNHSCRVFPKFWRAIDVAVVFTNQAGSTRVKEPSCHVAYDA